MRHLRSLAGAALAACLLSCSGESTPSDGAPADAASEPLAEVGAEAAPDGGGDASDASDSSDTSVDVDATGDGSTDADSDADGDAGAIFDAESIPTVFGVPGTHAGDVLPTNYLSSTVCRGCHGAGLDPTTSPHGTWSGSLMGNAGRDPLFFAQLTTANQDVPGVGYYCLRCHVPMAVATGHALDPTGNSLDDQDRDGVSCHLCHSLVDPLYKPGTSPAEDQPILGSLASPPTHYGDAMFVLDPIGLRRGPYSDANAPHPFVQSAFHKTGELCGTCHDVGNPAIAKQSDGTYRYADPNQPPSDDPLEQFPLERTYTEWKLSAFANGGVDMQGRFGGDGASVVSTCEDCHMPRTDAMGCAFGPTRPDLARHDFAGASAWVLDIVAAANPGKVDPAALAQGRASAVSMLSRAATLETTQNGATLHVRVINESGHKLPTGHIEGRRAWVNVRVYDASKALLVEDGGWDPQTADLDAASTTVFEMVIGLSAAAAQATGLPEGPTAHMSLADTIVKDTRIPPRGFVASAYEEAGAPATGAAYVDGQHWADLDFALPPGAASATVTLYYQTVTREYVEALRDGNVTDDRGQTLHDLWVQSGKGAPIAMATKDVVLVP